MSKFKIKKEPGNIVYGIVLYGCLLFTVYVFSTDKAKAQDEIWAAREYPKSTIDSVHFTGAGISGPGKAICENGFGGIAVGVVVSQENKSRLASGSVITSGLIPNIKPLWDVHMRDAVICKGGDGYYYLTGSTGFNIWNYNDGIEIYCSKDLRKWNYLGLVWSIEKDGGWEKQWRELHGKPVRSIWAPEIHYIHHNYYICFSMPPGGIAILKSITGKPEGPYVHATDPGKPLLGGIGPIPASFLIDPSLFEDEDGKVYFVQGPGDQITRMKDDLSDFAEPLHHITLSDPDTALCHHSKACSSKGYRDLGFEGATLFKHNGKYYLGSTDKYEGRYSIMLVMSDDIYGPYTGRYESVPCNGGTGFFEAENGDWFTCFFGDDSQAPWREKPGIIKIDFDKEGKVFIAKNQPDFILAPSKQKK
ncbi:MAG: family 43 glycosylhydrolase [Bacteroidota bacterium]|nr:family 43 glycosylhydrolase [Bacteroidota bacterium]MDP4273090.1 family 43 glycosylhydrolase [Bacteroidota bacterium]